MKKGKMWVVAFIIFQGLRDLLGPKARKLSLSAYRHKILDIRLEAAEKP